MTPTSGLSLTVKLDAIEIQKLPCRAVVRENQSQIIKEKMVPTGGRLLNRSEETNDLFKTLDHWNHILEALRKESTKTSTDRLPQAKRRTSPPVQRKRKIGGGK